MQSLLNPRGTLGFIRDSNTALSEENRHDWIGADPSPALMSQGASKLAGFSHRLHSKGTASLRSTVDLRGRYSCQICTRRHDFSVFVDA